MPPKHVPRVRKQKARARAASGAPSTNSDTNVIEVVPDKQAAIRAAALAELRSQQSVPKISSKKAKRLEHYIDTKLKKERNTELIKKLAEGQKDVDRSLFRSTKNLGRGKETQRERLKGALELERRGLAGDEEKELLYDTRVSEEDSDDGVIGASKETPNLQKLPVERPQKVESQSIFGAGLKRPLYVDEDGKPVIKKRKRRKPAHEKLLAPVVVLNGSLGQDEDFAASSGASSFGADNDDEWNGFSDDSQTNLENAVTSESSEHVDGSADEVDEVSSQHSSPEDATDASSDEDDASSASTASADGESRTALFKEWAEQQRNKALGYTPASQTMTDSATPLPTHIHHEAKRYNAIKAPAVGPLNIKPNELTTSAVVERSTEVQEARLQLPVVQEEQRIMEAIHANSITVVCGATGSGKTTQVPQMMFESGFGSKIGEAGTSTDKRSKGMIGVTQPRRVAATSVADRVAAEMGSMKNRVGHQVRFDSAVGPSTAIKFMTDGILLREVASDFTLSRYSAIVIDEAHERSVNTDILIGLLSRIVDLRRELSEEKPETYYPLKLVIMSATMRVEDFTNNSVLFRDGPPPIVEAEGRQYPVVNHFARQTKRDYLDEMFKKVSRGHKKLPKGGILVFLTGQAEILTLMRRLQRAFPTTGRASRMNLVEHTTRAGQLDDSSRPRLNGEDFSEDEIHGLSDDEDEFQIEENQEAPPSQQPVHILPLYSQLPASQQQLVFQAAPETSRLIILATNVAETSLTIPGIRYVFDSGRSKQKNYSPSTGISSFSVSWISKASAAQRAGRAGRTGPGHCYRLYSSAVYERDFEEYAVPEILRSPVESVALLVKSVDFPNVAAFPFPTPPDRMALARAEKVLSHLGAVDRRGKITELGKRLAGYPLSPRFGRMLVLAEGQGLLAHTIALVSALAVPELLIAENMIAPKVEVGESDSESDDGRERRLEEKEITTAAQEKLKAFKKAQAVLARWDDRCDALKLLMALVVCDSPEHLSERCEEFFVREKGMKEALELRQQLVRIVQGQVVAISTEDLTKLNVLKPDQRAALKYILAAGFADQVAIRADLLTGYVGGDRKPRRAIEVPYRTLLRSYQGSTKEDEEERDVFIHPSSVLSKLAVKDMPQFIIYHDLSQSAPKVVGDGQRTRTRLHPLTTVSGKQLLALMDGTEMLEVGKPIGKVDVLPRGDDGRERRECWVGVGIQGQGQRWEMGSRKERQVREGGEWRTEAVLA